MYLKLWECHFFPRDEPQQSKRNFSFWGHWLFIWENDLVLKLELTVLGEIWPFEGDLCSCAEPYRLFCKLHLELWECHFCFVKWAKAMEKNCKGSDETIPGSASDPYGLPHPATKFRGNPLARFSVILLSDSQWTLAVTYFDSTIGGVCGPLGPSSSFAWHQYWAPSSSFVVEMSREKTSVTGFTSCGLLQDRFWPSSVWPLKKVTWTLLTGATFCTSHCRL